MGSAIVCGKCDRVIPSVLWLDRAVIAGAVSASIGDFDLGPLRIGGTGVTHLALAVIDGIPRCHAGDIQTSGGG